MKRPHIVIHLPYIFSVRDFLFTDVWQEMACQQNARFTLLCNDVHSSELINERHVPHIAGMRLWGPRSAYGKSLGRGGAIWELLARWVNLYYACDVEYFDPSLAYRFAAVNRLSGYQVRKQRSLAEQERFRVFSEYRQGERAGFPMAKSRAVFKLLYWVRHGRLNVGNWCYRSLVRNLCPDLFVFGRLHYAWTPYLVRALKQSGVPMVGIVASWDHLTTKCPTPAGMSRYIVASRRMAEELSQLHGIEAVKIAQIGKVQMDIYRRPSTILPKQAFLQTLGVPADCRLVTFGTNATGLKEHEVSIARHLADAFRANRYGKVVLLIRAHPQDRNWGRDFAALECPPFVRCIKAAGFAGMSDRSSCDALADQVQLANLMHHSDVVIQSRGSLALDAIAFDTPVISIAFDGDLDREPRDSFGQEYEYEHYKPIVRAEGTWVVGSYRALDEAIHGYLADPGKFGSGRARIRSEQIEPFDGKAGRRLVDFIMKCAANPKQNMLASADCKYSGLGDTTWASRQVMDVSRFIRC